MSVFGKIKPDWSSFLFKSSVCIFHFLVISQNPINDWNWLVSCQLFIKLSPLFTCRFSLGSYNLLSVTYLSDTLQQTFIYRMFRFSNMRSFTQFFTITHFYMGQVVTVVCFKSSWAMSVMFSLKSFRIILYIPEFLKRAVLSYGFPYKNVRWYLVLYASLITRSIDIFWEPLCSHCKKKLSDFNHEMMKYHLSLLKYHLSFA